MGWYHLLQEWIWGPVMILFLLGTGLYFTMGSGWFQLRKIGAIFRHTLGSLFSTKQKSQGGISPFQAVSTALAGTMGTGNIAGVATAITAGGPGAVFWMWVSAVLGMMTKYAEVALAIRYQVTGPRGERRGGPMYYLDQGLGRKELACIFSVFCAAASFGIGNMAQSNSIAESVYGAVGIPPIVTGTVVAAVVGFVVVGGIQRIGKTAELLIPFLSILYLGCCFYVLYDNWQQIPAAFCLIVDSAFHPLAPVGGAAGYGVSQAIRLGAARGVFSNEAGLGSAPIAHGAADAQSPAIQGMWGIVEVFLDTILCCTLTTLVILTAGEGELWRCGLDGAQLTAAAFSQTLGEASTYLVAFCMLFFALSSMLGWCFYGEKALEYLFPHSQRVIDGYRFCFIALAVVGACVRVEAVWSLCDLLNGLMAIPNLIGLLFLSPQVFAIIRQERRGAAFGRVKRKNFTNSDLSKRKYK